MDTAGEDWVILTAATLVGGGAPRQARGIVREALTGLLDHRRLNDALTATGEIVTNAVQHAPGSYRLTVSRLEDGSLFRIGVADSNPDRPLVGVADPWASRGRGLRIVDDIASSWGSTPLDDGKEVWFDITSR